MFIIILAAIKIISTAIAIKTFMQGVVEGDIAKAVIGGIGAAVGVSSLLPAAATGAEAVAGGVEAASDVGTITQADSLLFDSGLEPVMDTTSGIASDVGGIVETAGIADASIANTSVLSPDVLAKSVADVAQPAAKQSVLESLSSTVSDFGEKTGLSKLMGDFNLGDTTTGIKGGLETLGGAKNTLGTLGELYYGNQAQTANDKQREYEKWLYERDRANANTIVPIRLK